MILCIDTKALNTSLSVQKDVDLEDLINNHTKYYNNEEEALKDNYVPLDFSVSVRSTHSNLVLQIDKDNKKTYYTNLTKVQPFAHKGYDLIMYLTSIGLMHSIDYNLGFDDLMMKHSQFQPIGLYNPDSAFLNPIIYSHVILSDEGAEQFKQYLKSGRELVPISSIVNGTDNLQAFIDTFIEVKEVSDSE